MKEFIDDVSIANEILSLNYKFAELWKYIPNHRRLIIQLYTPNTDTPYNPDIDEVLYIIMYHCQYMSGSFRLDNPRLRISQNIIEESSNEILTILEDVYSAFKIVSDGGFSLARGTISDFGDMFQNFG